MEVKIYPSVIAADFSNLERSLKSVEEVVDGFHLDIMDGVYVPNITFGMPVVKAIRKITNKYLDAHLMIVNADKYVDIFAELGVNSITVHYEAVTHLHRLIDRIKNLGCKAGVSLNPHTPVHLLEEILPYIDLVLIMSVNPGFTGQKFIESSIKKVEKLKRMIEQRNLQVDIMVDGGVNKNNIYHLVKAGANSFVAGASIFFAQNPKEAVFELRKCAKGGNCE